MSASHNTHAISHARECCIHEAIHTRKMEGIHTGKLPRHHVTREAATSQNTEPTR